MKEHIDNLYSLVEDGVIDEVTALLHSYDETYSDCHKGGTAFLIRKGIEARIRELINSK